VPERVSFDYAPIRVVPRVERDEFVHAGLVMRCLSRDFLRAEIALDPAPLTALVGDIDADVITRHLEAIVRVCEGGAAAGPLGALNQRERWHWLIAPRSAVIQVGPVHVGLCDDPATAFSRILRDLLRRTP
jgi:hypothetical protein